MRALVKLVRHRLHLLIHGLPDIEVKYMRRELGSNKLVLVTSFFYPGLVRSKIDGHEYQSLNGTFTVEQPVEASITL